MSHEFEPLDALRQPIKLGERYAYSSVSNGFTRICCGTAVFINKSGSVTLDIDNIDEYLYGKLLDDPANKKDLRKKSIRPLMLFPVPTKNP